MNHHASEIEIQEYALQSKDSISPVAYTHIDECAHCQQKVQQYRHLFAALDQHETAAMDFSVADAVMRRLPATRRTVPAGLAYLLIGIAALTSLGVGYSMIPPAWIKWISGGEQLFLGLLAIGGTSLLVFLLAVQWRRYHHTMRSIDKINSLQPY